MRKKRQNSSPDHGTVGFDHLATSADLYSSGTPAEQPLYDNRRVSDAGHVHKTGRHQAVVGRRKETADPREKMALLAILKSVIVILLLMITFFLLWKGIKLYEEKVWMETQGEKELSPVLRDVVLIEEIDIAKQDAEKVFAERIKVWRESQRLIGSVDTLLARGNIDQAIKRCQDALLLDPAHSGALERLGELYFEKGLFIESVNSYIRLLSVDPSREDLQVKLIQSLDALGDSKSVVFMAKWYQEDNLYNEDVQRFLANALFVQKQFAEAAKAYERVLVDNANDIVAREKLADSYMQLEQYDKALTTLETLRVSNYREQRYYYGIAVCNAQLRNSEETVQALGKAAHLFGQKVVVAWVKDPKLDPVREDRAFQAFADRVGGEEFRKWLEQMARTMDGPEREEVTPQLKLPTTETIDAELLQPRK
ncbi:tetratricopeptide repeat protein [Pontiella sp.]|uniref:tetratricopeptide repeat protein n=1 Tax=Pontiella sp. TaxID=2837462 RepID=UPI0035665179